MSLSPTRNIETASELLAYAKDYCQSGSTGGGPVENNFSSTLVMVAEVAQHGGGTVDAETVLEHAECGVLQIAFLNRGVNPLSVFITDAYENGWRYRNGQFIKKG